MESNTRFLIIPQVSDQRVCLLDARVIRFRAVFRRVLTSRLNSPSSLLLVGIIYLTSRMMQLKKKQRGKFKYLL